MRKHTILFIISIGVFILCFSILNIPKNTSTDLLVEINAVVHSDDIFQIFYQKEDFSHFSEKQSIRTQVQGQDKVQKINFYIPISDKPINRLRIDVGENKKQKSIVIKSIKLNLFRNSVNFKLEENFSPNSYIKIVSDTVNLQMVNGIYDPFFTSTFNVQEVIDGLGIKQPLLDKKTVILTSLIISITLFFVFLYKNINFNFDWSIITIFLLILIAPLLSDFLDFEIETANLEKRKLAKKPKLELTESYPKEYESYFNDNFRLRTLLVNWNSRLKLNYFNVSPKPESVLFGKEGFLFYNSRSVYDSYSNKNMIENQKLEKLLKKQIKLKNDLEAKGIKYVLGFFPNKHTIYKEYFSYSMEMQVNGDTSLASQIVSYFNKNEFPIVDVRGDLLLAKEKNQLYFKYDTHWNSYGAYVAYKSFCEQTSETLNLTPYDLNSFNITYSNKRDGDLIPMIGLKEMESNYDIVPSFVLKDNKIGYKIIDNEGYPAKTVVTLNEKCANKKTVLIFRDSYTSALIPFLSLHFHKVIYIWQHSVDINMVEKYNPDIIMSLPVERYIGNLLK